MGQAPAGSVRASGFGYAHENTPKSVTCAMLLSAVDGLALPRRSHQEAYAETRRIPGLVEYRPLFDVPFVYLLWELDDDGRVLCLHRAGQTARLHYRIWCHAQTARRERWCFNRVEVFSPPGYLLGPCEQELIRRYDPRQNDFNYRNARPEAAIPYLFPGR